MGLIQEIDDPPVGLRVRDGSGNETTYLCWWTVGADGGRCGKDNVTDIGLCGVHLVAFKSAEGPR